MEIILTVHHKGKIREIPVRKGLGFQGVCAKHVIGLEFDCRKADCGICNIKILSGGEHLSPPTAAEADFLKAMRADPDERLACQVRILGDVAVEVDYL
jgi:hypothetical protein